MQTKEKLSKLNKRKNNKKHIHSFNFQIGNYVSYNNKPIKIISIYNNNKIGFYNDRNELVFINSANVEPILITKDILEQNNFKLDTFISEKTNKDIYSLTTNKNNIITITFDDLYDDIFTYVDDDHRIGLLSAYIKYIHQLQNLIGIIEDDINIKI